MTATGSIKAVWVRRGYGLVPEIAMLADDVQLFLRQLTDAQSLHLVSELALAVADHGRPQLEST